MKRLTPSRIAWLAVVVGAALIAVGLSAYSPPLGVIFLGVVLGGWGLVAVDVDATSAEVFRLPSGMRRKR
jgi:hypothetical protein